jgi:hypothetical protein
MLKQICISKLKFIQINNNPILAYQLISAGQNDAIQIRFNNKNQPGRAKITK